MNGMLRMQSVDSTLLFHSEIYSERVFERYAEVGKTVNRLIAENHAVMFSWNPDAKTKVKLIFFPFEDKYGNVRAATFINNMPQSHTNSIYEAVKHVVYATAYSDVFYKTC